MVFGPLPGKAAEYRAGHLTVTQPWSRPTAPGTSVGAVYFSIANLGSKPDLLVGLTTPAALQVELHETRKVQGVLEMRPLHALPCPPGVTVKSQPGGLHIMLLGLARPLAAGGRFPLILHFRDAGFLTVQVMVGEGS